MSRPQSVIRVPDIIVSAEPAPSSAGSQDITFSLYSGTGITGGLDTIKEYPRYYLTEPYRQVEYVFSVESHSGGGSVFVSVRYITPTTNTVIISRSLSLTGAVTGTVNLPTVVVPFQDYFRVSLALGGQGFPLPGLGWRVQLRPKL